MVATWRPLIYFLASNVDIGPGLVNKIRELNGGGYQSTEVITNLLFKDNTGLNAADCREMADWLFTLSKVTGKDLTQKLAELRKRRMIKWHVYVAPDSFVTPERSMTASLIVNCH